MTMRELLAEIGLGRIADAIDARSQPSLRLTAGNPCARAVSRLGGQPNLPEDVPWPVSSDGQPLSFISQLDLATFPAVPELPLPCDGALFFFYDAVSHPWGFDPKDRGCAKVVYSPAPLVAQELRAPHSDLDEEAQFNGVALTATLEISLPNQNVFHEFNATEEEWEACGTLVNPLNGPVYRMGGHADEIQGDLRLKAHFVSNGLYCGDGSGYDEGRERGLTAGAADWRLLLQVDSEHRTGMEWGDEGRLFFMIHKDDLVHRRFDNVWVILQTT